MISTVILFILYLRVKHMDLIHQESSCSLSPTKTVCTFKIGDFLKAHLMMFSPRFVNKMVIIMHDN